MINSPTRNNKNVQNNKQVLRLLILSGLVILSYKHEGFLKVAHKSIRTISNILKKPKVKKLARRLPKDLIQMQQLF